MCARLLAIVAVFCLCGLPATPQETPTIVVVDQERLFEASLFGRRIAREVEDLSTELAAENRAIEAELMAEERDLTERRAGLEAAEFRALADAFDAKVEELRAEQDAKARELVALRDGERQNFSRIVGPILLEYMRQSGAAIMLDRRSIVVSSERADVTEELIAMIDERVGDGPPLEPDGLSTPDESPGESAGTDITGDSE
jgi:Skp family chaperone for outer membrane proteins